MNSLRTALPPWRARAALLTVVALVAGAAAAVLPSSPAAASTATYAYVTNSAASSASVVDTGTNIVTATVGVENGPNAVAVTPAGHPRR